MGSARRRTPSAGSSHRVRHDLDRRDHLPDVSLGVLGGVKQQPQHGGGQLRAADTAGIEEPRRVRVTELLQRPIDRANELFDQACGCDVGRRRIALRPGNGDLLRREGFATGIREQPIEAARRMPRVKTRRSRPTRPRPELIRRQTREVDFDFLAALEQRVRDGLQLRGNPFDRSAQPDFRFSHSVVITCQRR